MTILDLEEVKDLNRLFILNKFSYNKSISNGDLYNYQEMIRLRYPEHWAKMYKDKWPVRIVYYDKNQECNIYEFYINRHTNMKNIFSMFKQYLECKKIALSNCFGNDIADLIMSYLPTILENNDIINNNIYVHARVPNLKNGKFITQHRLIVPEDYTINQLHGKLSQFAPQLSRYTMLRIRAIKSAKPTGYLNTSFCW
tara:strand:- start:504 stop:1097 length:594 start_codon:yes stop_codon:yes gene_type:complete